MKKTTVNMKEKNVQTSRSLLFVSQLGAKTRVKSVRKATI